MAFVNHAKKEINAKIVYYGPERVGKTTSLRYVYDRIRPHLRGELKTLPVGGASLHFYDFTPYERPVFGDYLIRLHMYSLQGRVDNLAAWKMILKGADGLVIVMDASVERVQAGKQSLLHLREILGSYGVCFDDIPTVLQLNKPESTEQIVAETALREMGLRDCRVFPVKARNGEGVLETLTALSNLVMAKISERDDFAQENSVVPATEVTEAATVEAPVTDSPVTDSIASESGECILNTSYGDVDANFSARIKAGQIVVDEAGVTIKGGCVSIPLQVSTSDGLPQRLVVTVMVAPG